MITFSVNKEEGSFVSTFRGEITDQEMLDAYQVFFDSGELTHPSSELVDLSESDVSRVSTFGLKRLAEYTEELFAQRGIATFYTAVYAPEDLPYGMSRMYSAMASVSPESVKVFRNRRDAEQWLSRKLKN